MQRELARTAVRDASVGAVGSGLMTGFMAWARPGGAGLGYYEVQVMKREMEFARALGASGIVCGALTAERRVDLALMRSLVEAANGLPVTFHRAFDLTRDPEEALDDLMAAGARITALAGDKCEGRTVRFRKALPDDENAWEELDEARFRRLIECAQPGP